jgi:hypothetical protein
VIANDERSPIATIVAVLSPRLLSKLSDTYVQQGERAEQSRSKGGLV